mmetsp:Transcript_22119/g.29561  ORF Transcript_22119/g.29561 Transcript_22119/m.29561 type:complete len:116 (-) Transcript_22119:283-630(-)|eukprot:CAMPEP_0185585176 /NCGR_PEP_ID=MMETSP0434-20130131/37026_1 /TAXON_ID=626734 ORGANISM="Favella taraikaensis, Strain Fe Narragansett Bay" /NCGR_SAMPLE_ID=MMETSP0434 /ASSEMBLY_ACC=CAM_ASM_000379 /LENGTH=115 /DNA_ID=CAMNT_0028205347 /DNA_START=203 /DNA_END=550 /DNA_ORIENTATION=+
MPSHIALFIRAVLAVSGADAHCSVHYDDEELDVARDAVDSEKLPLEAQNALLARLKRGWHHKEVTRAHLSRVTESRMRHNAQVYGTKHEYYYVSGSLESLLSLGDKARGDCPDNL